MFDVELMPHWCYRRQHKWIINVTNVFSTGGGGGVKQGTTVVILVQFYIKSAATKQIVDINNSRDHRCKKSVKSSVLKSLHFHQRGWAGHLLLFGEPLLKYDKSGDCNALSETQRYDFLIRKTLKI